MPLSEITAYTLKINKLFLKQDTECETNTNYVKFEKDFLAAEKKNAYSTSLCVLVIVGIPCRWHVS